ncbi:MAG: nucleotidyltransferase domain-containing protein, partial [Nitrospirae bacterium]
MFKTEKESIERIVRSLSEHFGSRLRHVVAFGSRVRGDFHAESDFDILIVIEGLSIEDEVKAIQIVSQEEEKTGIP